ncbi:MAG: hypothetical protein EWV91_07070 [Microcystis aeruginosa Ma_QC_Ca_00000000_S207]|uniref:Uncharacterized protein n=1 Tax=Microcystis aeruginosa Ma_QC_Ca_00000000_S207 TaxID=2486251 RepID=A0A552FSW6_MICAE|nr:MAG: hypothetical protein EWV91_07070 [Microcystis aeruginosa Ma_QC_Ca_00000000_S207]
MDLKTSVQDSSGTNIFLTGAILFANLDYSGLGEYAIKAAIGGAVWMAFKLTSDYLSEKIKRNTK